MEVITLPQSMTENDVRNHFELCRSVGLRRSSNAYTRHSVSIRDDEKLWFILPLILAAVRKSTTTLNFDRIN